MEYSEIFLELIESFLNSKPKYKRIFSASISQFILESARGASKLAIDHNNFAGIKWRPEMAKYSQKVLVEAPSETAYFCSFLTIDDFVNGYWAFLNRAPYKGWEDHSSSPYAFIDFVGPIWAADPAYVEKIKDLFAEADQVIAASDSAESSREPDAETFRASEAETLPAVEAAVPCCGGMADDETIASNLAKPTVEWDPSPFNWSRGGTSIDTIVIHYTTTRNLQSTVDWFKNPSNPNRTAAHYVIGRNGRIIQMVKDSDACTHGNSQNRRSIGIEHSAAAGDKMTTTQENSSLAMIRWLMSQYSIGKNRIIAHKCAPRATSCPGDLFQDYGATSASTCPQTRTALQAWLNDKL